MMSQKESGTWLVKLGGEAEWRGGGGQAPPCVRARRS